MSSGAIPKATPFDAAIAEVQAKIEELKTTLATLLRLQAEQGGAPSPTAALRGGDAEISHDTFFNMTIGEAAKKYLAIVKTTKSTAEIAEWLERGGLKHSSKSFTTTVRSILGAREDFTRVPNGDWGLAEWYPGMGRGKKPKEEKPARASRQKKTSNSGESTPKKRQPIRTSQQRKNEATPGSLNIRVLNLLEANPTLTFSAPEIAARLGAHVPSVAAALSAMLKVGKIARPVAGRYQSKTGPTTASKA